MHAVGQVALVPVQSRPPAHAGLPGYVLGASVHLPSAVAPSDAAQTSHAPAHALSQQKPSEANPVAHEAPLFDAWPVFSLHAPDASHGLKYP